MRLLYFPALFPFVFLKHFSIMFPFTQCCLFKYKGISKAWTFKKYTELVRDVEADDSLGSSNHEMVKSEILKEVSKTNTERAALDFRRGRFCLVQRSAWQDHAGDCFKG